MVQFPPLSTQSNFIFNEHIIEHSEKRSSLCSTKNKVIEIVPKLLQFRSIYATFLVQEVTKARNGTTEG